MNNLKKRILSFVTAAALVLTSADALPDIGGFELPDLSVPASAVTDSG